MSRSHHHDKENNHIHFSSSSSREESSCLIDPNSFNEVSVSTVLDSQNKLSLQNETDKSCDSCGPCDLCHTIKADPTNISKHGGRLLTVKIKVTNVCLDKKVSVACIIYGRNEEILVFKAFTTILFKENEHDKCGTIERTLLFVVPNDDIFDPCNLDVRVIANYIYPCQ
jgi:hypothetical protein